MGFKTLDDVIRKVNFLDKQREKAEALLVDHHGKIEELRRFAAEVEQRLPKHIILATPDQIRDGDKE